MWISFWKKKAKGIYKMIKAKQKIDKIKLWSIVCVTHLTPSQSCWDKDVINQYAIVTKGNNRDSDKHFMLANLSTGHTNGWWGISQLKMIGQIDSLKVADRIIKRCNQMSELRCENAEELVESKIFTKVYF